MSKRGTLFVCIVEGRGRQPAVWDPHAYRVAEASARLGDLVEVRSPRRSGGGGTRPRLQPEALAATRVSVPELEERAAINRQLEDCAAREWRAARRRRAIIRAARLAD